MKYSLLLDDFDDGVNEVVAGPGDEDDDQKRAALLVVGIGHQIAQQRQQVVAERGARHQHAKNHPS